MLTSESFIVLSSRVSFRPIIFRSWSLRTISRSCLCFLTEIILKKAIFRPFLFLGCFGLPLYLFVISAEIPLTILNKATSNRNIRRKAELDCKTKNKNCDDNHVHIFHSNYDKSID